MSVRGAPPTALLEDVCSQLSDELIDGLLAGGRTDEGGRRLRRAARRGDQAETLVVSLGGRATSRGT